MKKINEFATIKFSEIASIDELHYPLLEPMLQVEIPAQGYINKLENSCFILGNNGWCYQLGNKSDVEFNNSIIDLLEIEMLERKEILWFGVPKINQKKNKFGLNVSSRYEFEYIGSGDYRINNNHEYAIYFAEEADLRQLYYKHEDISTYWSSLDKYIKNGFSYVAKIEDQIIGYVTSASYCRSIVEIDIWTDERYRGQGISTTLCKCFIGYCIKEDLIPKWDCSEDNQTSINLAKKLGFRIKKKYDLGYIFQNQNIV